MRPVHLLLLVAGLVIAAIAILLLWPKTDRAKPTPAAAPSPAAGVESERRASTADDPKVAPPPASSNDARPARPGVDPLREAARRAELLRQIRRADNDTADDRIPPPPPPSAALPAPSGRARLGKEEIRTAVRAVTPLLHDCYHQRLKENEGLAGKAVVKFTIVARDGEGRLDEGEIKRSTLEDLRLETCMLHALTRARFPLPQGEGKITVTYPFIFRPKAREQ
jgi:hypothetical protein